MQTLFGFPLLTTVNTKYITGTRICSSLSVFFFIFLFTAETDENNNSTSQQCLDFIIVRQYCEQNIEFKLYYKRVFEINFIFGLRYLHFILLFLYSFYNYFVYDKIVRLLKFIRFLLTFSSKHCVVNSTHLNIHNEFHIVYLDVNMIFFIIF